jgi:hypothetical protein
MSTVATTTTHAALVLRNAVDAVTTELVRANVAPDSISVSQAADGTTFTAAVSMQIRSREEFDSAVSLFGLDQVFEFDCNDDRRVAGHGRFMGLFVSASAPAFPAVVADCDAASLT